MKTYQRGKFGGKFDSSQNINLLHILRWKILQKPKFSLSSRPVIPLVVEADLEGLRQKEDFICWLSHASFLIQLGGKRIIIDPVLNDIPFYKRQIPAPYTVEELGKIDYVLISHTHYDHCDKRSLSALASKEPKAIVPLKMTQVLQHMKLDMPTKELDWYETYDEGELSITFVPARHWGRRGVFDKNAVLWGGYILSYQNSNIYFCGDSASGSHFEEIGQRYDIDIALLPIGAYAPEFIMKENHLNPQEAFDAFIQLKAKRMIPMHYGTFDLTDEPLDEPLLWMQEIATKNPNKICFMKAGEILTLTSEYFSNE